MKLQRYTVDEVFNPVKSNNGYFVKADEAEALEGRLAKAEKVLKMYADEKNWTVYRYIQNKVKYERWCADFGPITAQNYFKDKGS